MQFYILNDDRTVYIFSHFTNTQYKPSSQTLISTVVYFVNPSCLVI